MNNPRIASCEPSIQIRQRARQDLNIVGQVDFPQEVDMRNIIMTYPILPTIGRSISAYALTPIAGFVFFNFDMFPVGVLSPINYTHPLNLKYWELKSWFLEIIVDAVGIAALLAAAEAVEVECFINLPDGTQLTIAKGRASIIAAPVIGTHFTAGSFETTQGFAGFLNNTFENEIRGLTNYKFLPNEFLTVTLRLGGGGNFPLNSTARCCAIFEHTSY
jgi:hypothetical protein